jgi:hypothetical protein
MKCFDENIKVFFDKSFVKAILSRLTLNTCYHFITHSIEFDIIDYPLFLKMYLNFLEPTL